MYAQGTRMLERRERRAPCLVWQKSSLHHVYLIARIKSRSSDVSWNSCCDLLKNMCIRKYLSILWKNIFFFFFWNGAQFLNAKISLFLDGAMYRFATISQLFETYTMRGILISLRVFIKGKERERIIKSSTVKLGERSSAPRRTRLGHPEFPCYLLLEIAPSICFALDPRDSLPSFLEFRCSGGGKLGSSWSQLWNVNYGCLRPRQSRGKFASGILGGGHFDFVNTCIRYARN